MLNSSISAPASLDTDWADPSCLVADVATEESDAAWVERAGRLLARFDEATPLGGREGLAAELLAWLRDGRPDTVLDELKEKRHARIADRLGLTGKALPEDPVRDAFYEGFDRMPVAAALRWARLLQQIVPGSARYSGIRLGGGRAWPTLLMMHAAGASVLLQTRTPPQVRHLSIDTMEALLRADGLPADSLLVAGFVTPARPGFLGWQPLLVGELAGFSHAVLRHIDAIRGLMVPTVPEQRLRVLALLKQIGSEAIEALAAELVVLALTGGRQVLAAAEPLLLRGGERMVAELSAVARDGTPDQRSGALRVIAKLARTHQREDWVDFCHETASADRAASVRTLLGEWAAQAQTDAALEQIVREAAGRQRGSGIVPLTGTDDEATRPGRAGPGPDPTQSRFDQPERAIAALSDGQAETRALAARHLGRIRHEAAIPALERALWVERNDDTRGALLGALQALDQPIDHFLDRDALAADAARTLARGIPTELAWLDWPTLPRVRWADSGETVAAEVVQALLIDAFVARDPEPGTQLRQISAQLDARDREGLGQWVLEQWLAGPQSDTMAGKGLLAIAAAFCGDQAAAPVQSYLRAWHDHRTAHCKALVTMLAGIDQPAATQLLLAIGRRFASAVLQDEARLQIQRKATRRGWTPIELADRTLPSAGFDEDGRLDLSYGARAFVARLRADLTIGLEDADGARLESLPEPRRGDDPILAIDAARALAAAQAELTTLVSQQTDRLYDAMCQGREWPVAEWRDHLLCHPVLRHLVARLVWIELNENSSRRAFRPTGDGALVDLAGQAVSLAPDARIIVAHDVLLNGDEALHWQQQLIDQQVRPLFRQLGRIVPTLNPDEAAISTFEGYLIKAFNLRSLAEKFGYVRGPFHDGRYDAYVKSSASLGLTARIEFSGSRLPEENRIVALGSLRLVHGLAHGLAQAGEQAGEETTGADAASRAVTRTELLAIFVTECLHDLNRIAMAGSGFDPAWREKIGD